MSKSPPRPPAVAHERFQAHRESLADRPLDERFSYIFESNLWGSDESRSGLGSALDATAALRAELPALLAGLGVKTLLDVPCGDFGWLSQVPLPIDRYVGADIVPAIVEANRARYGGAAREFVVADLTRDDLPRADLVLCRDCLVHLSFANVRRALANVRRSGAAYLLTTTFLDHEENEDIDDGDWRLLNLTRAPFDLPPPEAVLLERCEEGGGAYRDKALGLWKLTIDD